MLSSIVWFHMNNNNRNQEGTKREQRKQTDWTWVPSNALSVTAKRFSVVIQINKRLSRWNEMWCLHLFLRIWHSALCWDSHHEALPSSSVREAAERHPSTLKHETWNMRHETWDMRPAHVAEQVKQIHPDDLRLHPAGNQDTTLYFTFIRKKHWFHFNLNLSVSLKDSELLLNFTLSRKTRFSLLILSIFEK